jgi:cytochrome P450
MSESGRALPGLGLSDREALFKSLLSLDIHGGHPIRVTVGGRLATLLTSPAHARAVLASDARKGRPDSSLRRIGGYVSQQGPEFRKARADVMAALRRAASDTESLHRALNVSGVRRPLALSLAAHLAGVEPDSDMEVTLAQGLSTIASLAEDAWDQTDDHLYRAAVDRFTALIRDGSAFVDELRKRGWESHGISREIMTLTFAGWSSLSAAIRTSTTMGVTSGSTSATTITEVLRIAPPGWLIVREVLTPVRLSSSMPLHGPGDLLVMSPWLLHRDPRGWHSPTEFDPERRSTRRSSWYLPFGAGPRACPAEPYARAFLEVALALLEPQDAANSVAAGLAHNRGACLLPSAEGTFECPSGS